MHISTALQGVIRLLEGGGILDIGLQCVSSCQLLSHSMREMKKKTTVTCAKE